MIKYANQINRSSGFKAFELRIGILAVLAVFAADLFAAEGQRPAVHNYGKSGDDPATEVDESAILASDDLSENKQYRESIKYALVVNDTPVSVYKYQKGPIGSGHYNFDIARFASEDQTPTFEIQLKDNTIIETVEIYPERYYPQEAVRISSNRKTLTFSMSDKLRYCIININGTLTDRRMAGTPMLAVINDPPETDKPDVNAHNVLNFKEFAAQYLKENPITDQIGQICRPAGSVTDTSRNTHEQFTWHYEAGKYVDQKERNVRFPNKRARVKHDVSEAFQAALEHVRKSPELDTIYFPAGTYIWSGLSIRNWDGNGADGKLNIYLDEAALLVNRLQECKEAMEPAIGIWYSSNITISGRGIIDGNACYTLRLDRKDARDTPHQGGAMVVHSEDITFNDTYVRDTKQWNWECHTVKHVTFNNIKGLSPFDHAWVDGLNLTSGRNVTVNGAFTLGNDDTFATGHYNPSDEFPRRFLDELDRATGDEKARMEAIKNEVCAAAAVYNKNRLKWDADDSEHITVNDVLAWSGLANNVRLGANIRWKGEPGSFTSYKLKSYTFNNFNSVMRRCMDAIKLHGGSHGSPPGYETLIFRNCSFAGAGGNNVVVPTNTNNFRIDTVVIDNCWFEDPTLPFVFRDVKNLILKDIVAGGQLVTDIKQLPITLETIGQLTFTAYDRDSAQARFVHPGLLLSQRQIDLIKAKVAAGEQPWAGGYETLRQNKQAMHSYPVNGPYATVGRGRNPGDNVYKRQFDSDCNAAHYNALMWVITNDKRHAAKAMEILNGYAATLKEIVGTDKILMASLNGAKLLYAAELLRYSEAGWGPKDTAQFETMMLTVFYPVIRDFAPFANGNWSTGCVKTMMAIGVFCNDRTLFDRAIDWYYHGTDNGSLTGYIINDEGQSQESGRDQAHAQLGIAHLAEACEIAFNQGLDLYGAADNRLLKGFEYAAKYNLGHTVPFVPYRDTTGKYNHQVISDAARGRLWPVYEMVYHHYRNRRDMACPFTQAAAQAIRPEGAGPNADCCGFGTLLFSLPEKENGNGT